MRKLIYGVGINDYKGKIKIDGKDLKSYKTWLRMLERCYSEKYINKHPTYKNCKVCKEWLYFSNFKVWFDENYNNNLHIKYKLCLDKDLLSTKDNKIYSPQTCIFLPQKVNKFLAHEYLNNTSGYSGVVWVKNDKKYVARIQNFDNQKTISLGYFNNAEDAYEAYKKARNTEANKVKCFLYTLGYRKDIIDKVS